MGLVSTAFKPEDLLKLRYGNLGIGHTRYSTTGMSELQNCQPFVVDTLHGKIAVAHNGELVNAAALRKKAGCLFIYLFSIYKEPCTHTISQNGAMHFIRTLTGFGLCSK